MSDIINRVLNNLQERRNKILNNKINSVPSPFTRFSNDFIGMEIGKYYIVSAATKVGKTQFASFLCLYNTIMYAYNNPDKLRLKIFYYPLEETPEQVTTRFITYLLYVLSKGKIIISSTEITSSKNVAIDQKIIDLLKSDEYNKILKFWEDTVIFSDSTNPSGVWFECQRYAKEHGEIQYEKYTVKDEFGIEQERDRFLYYKPDDEDEMKIIFFDHVGLCQNERGMDLRQTMNKLSEYFVLLRNRYKFTIVAIQQQTMTGDDLNAFKANKLRPSLANLGDAKTLARDCDMCIGLFSPYRHELPSYMGYDVTKFRDNIRFAEILINRSGPANGIIGLLFLGQCNFWNELPPATDTTSLDRFITFLTNLRTNKLANVILLMLEKCKIRHGK